MNKNINQKGGMDLVENRDSNPMQAAPEAPEDEISSHAPSRSKKWLIGGGILVLFLVAAVFLGARLLKNPSGAANAGGMADGGHPSLSSVGGSGGGEPTFIPAAEIPQEQSITGGLFVKRADQSIFIGTGKITTSVQSNGPAGGGDAASQYDGPVVEVVIGHQTKIYQDLTSANAPEPDVKNPVIKQVVKPGSLDDLTPNSMVSVWGEKQGDRYIAKVILYQ
jgi:hypothetical protein